MPLYISRNRLRPLGRLASKKSVIIEGHRYEDGPFVEVTRPLQYRLKRPWMRVDDLVEIASEFNGIRFVPGPIEDDIHDQLLEKFG